MQPRNITIHPRITSEFYLRLQKLCEIKNVSVSEYCRTAIMAAVKKEKDVYQMLMDDAVAKASK